MTYDLLIRNGRIVDGSGMPSFRGDLAGQGRGEKLVCVKQSDLVFGTHIEPSELVVGNENLFFGLVVFPTHLPRLCVIDPSSGLSGAEVPRCRRRCLLAKN